MKFQIRHEIRGRMRIHVIQSRMSFAQADTLQYYLEQCESVISAKIQNRTEDVTICYEGSRDAILEVLKAFSYEKTDVPDTYIKNSGREMNQHYWDQLVEQTVAAHKQDWEREERKAYKKRCKSRRKALMIAILLLNFGILAVLKYYNFLSLIHI